MARKFILTQNGVIRLGEVRMHKDLLQPNDICWGGGFYEFDYGSNLIILSGQSFDFGEPRWERFFSRDITLKMPEEYRGMGIVYKYDDDIRQDVPITQDYTIEYI